MNENFAIIPLTVLHDQRLPASAKLLFGELSNLCQQTGYCWASNAYLAKLFRVDKLTVSRWIAALRRAGYIFLDGVDENINTIDENVPKGRRICIGTIYKKINQNNKMNNKKNISRAHVGASGETKTTFDLDAYKNFVANK